MTVKDPGRQDRPVIGSNGVTDPPDQLEHELQRVRAARLDDEEAVLQDTHSRRLGQPRKDAADLIAHSPLRQADRIGIPVLLIAGIREVIVPHERSARLANELERPGRPHRCVAVKDMPHGVALQGQMREVSTAAERFLAEHLELRAVICADARESDEHARHADRDRRPPRASA